MMFLAHLLGRGGIGEVGYISGEGREESDGGGEGEESDESDEGEEEGDEDGGRLRVDHSNNGSDYDEDANSDMPHSDILTSPPRSDDEYEVTSQSRRRRVTEPSKFQMADMGNTEFVVGQKFSSIQVFQK